MSSDLMVSKENSAKLILKDVNNKPIHFLCPCGSKIANTNNSIRMHQKTKKHIIYEINLKEERQRLLKDYIKKNPNATEQELLDLIY